MKQAQYLIKMLNIQQGQVHWSLLFQVHKKKIVDNVKPKICNIG